MVLLQFSCNVHSAVISPASYCGCILEFSLYEACFLPACWQDVANPLARYCQHVGKTLPIGWQKAGNSIYLERLIVFSISSSIFLMSTL